MGLYFGQAREVGVEDVTTQNELGKLSFALDFYKAGSFEFFDVVRERGGAQAMPLAKVTARHCRRAGADLGEDLVASRFGQRARYASKLLIGKPNRFPLCIHRLTLRLCHLLAGIAPDVDVTINGVLVDGLQLVGGEIKLLQGVQRIVELLHVTGADQG